MALYKLKALFLKKIWGGTFFSENHPKKFLFPIGESLEVSTLKNNDVWVENQDKIVRPKLQKLSEVITNKITYLVKFIDTSDHLSVQVHPNDYWAKKLENSSGKTECWLILNAKNKSGIYLGFKEGISKAQLKYSLSNNEKINHLLKFYPVKAGDFFYVPAGTIHAIGEGVTLIEVQQSSGITYRVWDWNRLDKNGISRDLHISKALQVLNFNLEENKLSNFRHVKNILEFKKHFELISHKDFNVQIFFLKKGESYDLLEENEYSIVFIEGEGQCHFESLLDFKKIKGQYDYIQFESFYKTGDTSVNVYAKEKTIFLQVF